MRIVEPKTFTHVNSDKSKKFKHKYKFGFMLLMVVLFTVLFLIFSKNESNSSVVVETIVEEVKTVNEDTVIETNKGNIFSGNEFRLLYDNLFLPNTQKVDTPPVITGNDVADARIRQLAELRGYKLRTSPASSLSSVDGFQLQTAVHEPWKSMQQEASKDGLNMSITSAYRSVDNQRSLFLGRLYAEGASIDKIVSGTVDEKIDKVLITTAVPGYSKHHSGYTFDLLCAGWVFENFVNSTCNTWLVKNNYEKAKEFGFIPSYPIGADLQGPEPEAWEYVYVGIDILNQ